MQMRHSKAAGFTLLELLVAITIVAMVSAIALPLYTQFSERSYRTEAQADLLNCVQALERWSAVNFSYLGAADEDGDELADDDGASDAGPLGLDVCRPVSVQQGRYEIEIAATATTYTLTAEPIGSMDGDGDMTIDEAGNRTWNEDDADPITESEEDWNEG